MDEEWISRRVNEAARLCPSMTEAAMTRIKQLIQDIFCDRHLRPAELTDAATKLLNDMVASLSEGKEANYEN